jgi:hypothetical protein
MTVRVSCAARRELKQSGKTLTRISALFIMRDPFPNAVRTDPDNLETAKGEAA